MQMKDMICTLGKFDIPIIQMQPMFRVNLLESNIMVLGSSMSGKTTLLRTLLNILHKQFNEKQEQVFILDFGGALSAYRTYPLIAAYFDNSNEEYVKRVFKIMDGILKENIQKLDGKNYPESDDQPRHTTFIIDNVNAFQDEPRYTTYQEKLAKLCRDGLSKGITLIMTASDNKGLGQYMGSFKQKIVFDLPQDKKMEIFNEKVGAVGNNPGHGHANVTVKIPNVPGSFRANLPYELQCCTPYSDAAHDTNCAPEANSADEFQERLKTKFGYINGAYQRCVRKYQTFPKELTRAEFDKLLEKSAGFAQMVPEDIPVGLDYVDFDPVSVNLSKSHVVGIYGKKEFGKTNLLRTILNGAAHRYPDLRVVLVDDGRKQLTDESLKLLKLPKDLVWFDDFAEVEWAPQGLPARKVKRSPLQQFYVYLNRNYVGWDKRALLGCYGINSQSASAAREAAQIEDCTNEPQPPTVFVLQSKMLYLNAPENKYFFGYALQQLNSVAEEKHVAFIFSDIQKFSETDQGQYLNNQLSVVFLLDNIAEFASERGQRSVFGSMDVKMLKEDYARCELGDGYYYDVEADNLKKAKFLKEDET